MHLHEDARARSSARCSALLALAPIAAGLRARPCVVVNTDHNLRGRRGGGGERSTRRGPTHGLRRQRGERRGEGRYAVANAETEGSSEYKQRGPMRGHERRGRGQWRGRYVQYSCMPYCVYLRMAPASVTVIQRMLIRAFGAAEYLWEIVSSIELRRKVFQNFRF